MKNLVFVVMFVLAISGCTNVNSTEPEPETVLNNFAYVTVEVFDNSGKNGYIDSIVLLNNWLRQNPNKKVISFSGVLAYREGVSGYVVNFQKGDNSHQYFLKLGREPYDTRTVMGEYSISSIQAWKDANQQIKLIAFSTVPAYSGGVKEFTLLCESK